MKSTAEHPLAFFDWYLKNQIGKDLKEFYINIKEELHFNDTDKIDRVNHVVKVLNVNHQEEIKSEYITFSFENSVKSKLNQEIKQTKDYLELGFEKRFSDKKEVKAYADFMRIKLDSYSTLTTVKEFPFLTIYFKELYNLINQFSKPIKNYSFVPSLVLLSDSPEEQGLKIEVLYNLLTEKPSMINCSKEEFNKAFTGQEITEGIHWLVTGKNKNYVSKPSLLYFLDELIDKGFLSRNIIHDLYKFIRYLFRDHKGNELKNLKQSREDMSDNPTSKNRINTIISSL
jgi:hypothetical protein